MASSKPRGERFVSRPGDSVFVQPAAQRLPNAPTRSGGAAGRPERINRVPWIIPTPSYRDQARLVRQYEPWRSVWRFSLGGLLFVSVPALPVAGFVAGAYLAGDLHEATRVIAGALVTVPLGWLSAYIWTRKPWRVLLDRRLAWWSTQTNEEGGTAWALLRECDWDLALRTIRRAKVFAPPGATRLATPPEDAPELCMSVLLSRPPALLKNGALGAGAQARKALEKAGIRARVDGVDVSEP